MLSFGRFRCRQSPRPSSTSSQKSGPSNRSRNSLQSIQNHQRSRPEAEPEPLDTAVEHFLLAWEPGTKARTGHWVEVVWRRLVVGGSLGGGPRSRRKLNLPL